MNKMPRDIFLQSNFKARPNVCVLIHDAKRFRSLDDVDSVLDTVRKHYDFDDPASPRLSARQQKLLLQNHLQHRGIRDFDLGSNKIVDIGIGNIWDVWLNKTSDHPTYNGVGTDATAPAAGQTQLLAQLERVAITRTFRAGLIAKLHTFWSENQGNSSNLNETSIHWASAGNNNMVCRRTFSAAKIKLNTDTMTIKWSLTGASAT